MAPVVAAHRVASALAVVMIALSLAARYDPEVLVVLAMICADPTVLATVLLMAALVLPEASPAR